MKGVTEFGGLLCLFPNLEELNAEFTDQENIFPLTRNAQYEIIKIINISYNGTASEQDLRMIMYRFRALRNLQLKFQGATFIREGTFPTLLQHIVGIPKYNIEMTDNFDINSVVLLLHKYYGNVIDCNHVVNIYYEYDTHRSIRVCFSTALTATRN